MMDHKKSNQFINLEGWIFMRHTNHSTESRIIVGFPTLDGKAKPFLIVSFLILT